MELLQAIILSIAGEEAFVEGEPLDSNPFRQYGLEAYATWRDAWLAAQREDAISTVTPFN